MAGDGLLPQLKNHVHNTRSAPRTALPSRTAPAVRHRITLHSYPTHAPQRLDLEAHLTQVQLLTYYRPPLGDCMTPGPSGPSDLRIANQPAYA